MDYKIVINTETEEISGEKVDEIFETLNNIIIREKNIDMENPSLFIVEGEEAALIGTTWGTQRANTEDMEELSSEYPDLTFYLIQASRILNIHHFEDLANYALFVYRGGDLHERMKPQPITWELVETVEYRENPW